MISALSLQNFRSYKKASFSFDPKLTIIVGPNTAGKSNLVESLFFMTTGKSFRTEKDEELPRFNEDFGRIKARIVPPPAGGSNNTNTTNNQTDLEVVFSTGKLEGKSPSKRFFVNGVARRRTDFVGYFPSILFSPLDLDIVIGSPGVRRRFLDDLLEQVDKEYRFATTEYAKALRQRNALLDRAKEHGIRDARQFAYWDEILIRSGTTIHTKREEFISFLNSAQKDVFNLMLLYDHSVISRGRLEQYRDAEIGAGNTLVGPHRDNMLIFMGEDREVKTFGSRGQQRLAVLQLKLLQLSYMEEKLGKRPTLLLDDIFSELDDGHIQLVLDMIGNQQTVITTTHEEFVPAKLHKSASMIELKR